MNKLLISLCLLSSAAMADYRSVNNEPVSFGEAGWQHLVFIDLWGSWMGAGPEAMVSKLPARFSDKVQQVWITPDMNVTLEYARQYQSYFPTSKPLVIDKGYKLIQHYKLWQTPAHVLLKDGKVQFSGDSDAFQHYVNQQF